MHKHSLRFHAYQLEERQVDQCALVSEERIVSDRLPAQPAFEVEFDDFLAGLGPCESTYPDGHRRFARDLDPMDRDPAERVRIWPEMGLRRKSNMEVKLTLKGGAIAF